jgi:hypothetical protein
MSFKKLFTYKTGTFLVLTAVLFFNQTMAQERTFATKGITEISGSFAYSSFTPVSNGNTSASTSIFTLTPQIGYFIQDGFEIGLSSGLSFLPGVTFVFPSGGNNTTILGLFFTPSYNFRIESKSVFPFIEGQLGYTAVSSGSSTSSGFSYGGKGGIKMIIADHVLLNFSAQYSAITLNPEGATERWGFNYLTLSIGVGAYL